MVRRIRAFSETDGTAAIEFAILAPVFLLMLAGMLAYALYFGAAHSVQQLAADAVRTSIAGLSEAERNSLVNAFLDANAAAYPLIDPERLEIVIGDNPDDPDQYRVQLAYDAGALPIWNLYPPLPLPDPIIVHGATVRLGGR